LVADRLTKTVEPDAGSLGDVPARGPDPPECRRLPEDGSLTFGSVEGLVAWFI
jgi:hypothetical protein